MRSPQIISVSWADNNCWNISKLSTLPTFSCLHEFGFFTKHTLALFLSWLIIVVHNLRWPGLDAVAVPAFITRTIYSVFVIWETEWENICEGRLTSPAFVCFIWIRESDYDCLCGEQMLLHHCHQLHRLACTVFTFSQSWNTRWYWSAMLPLPLIYR